ncbi:hypothetical protein B0O99DRAFT_16731 [Bisporella sp. PMI_857]|nr:hypothetical protein B0O99DRAFT_16731 [Bisporella sp. PMI_857]
MKIHKVPNPREMLPYRLDGLSILRDVKSKHASMPSGQICNASIKSKLSGLPFI